MKPDIKLKKHTIQLTIISLFTLIIFFVSACDNSDLKITDEENECENPDYNDCNTKEPFRDSLHIQVTINEENEKVKITVYEGDIENGVVVNQIESTETDIFIDVLLNSEYSAAARYISGNDTIIAIDGTEIEKTSETYCDSTCWSIKGEDIDLRLK